MLGLPICLKILILMMNLNKTLNLSECISLSELNKIIDRYREIIELEISNFFYNDGYN